MNLAFFPFLLVSYFPLLISQARASIHTHSETTPYAHFSSFSSIYVCARERVRSFKVEIFCRPFDSFIQSNKNIKHIRDLLRRLLKRARRRRRHPQKTTAARRRITVYSRASKKREPDNIQQ